MQDQGKKKSKERWYLSAIDYLIIDTQVARRGRQYHSNPPPYKNRPTKATGLQNIQQERLEKRLSKLIKKNIDRKTACPKCRNPPRPTKNKTVLQKATNLQNIKHKLVKSPSDPSYKRQKTVLQKATDLQISNTS